MFKENIIHNKECVDFYTLPVFRAKVKKFFKADKIEFDTTNNGVYVTRNGLTKHYIWWELAEEMEWFDDAEIVTDKDEKEKVMVWLNV